jgi:hypothetical protein
MRAHFTALLILAAFGTSAFAREIRKGATMEVKANSIWFGEAAKLTRWQALKKSGRAAAFAAYQDQALSNRDAWQFLNQLTVKILRYDAAKNQVNVEMETEGRMHGSTWFLDAGALVQ